MSGGTAREAGAEARLAELAAEHALTGPTVAALRVLLGVFATDEHAATTVRAPREAVDRHVADGLSGLLVPEVVAASTIVDIGTGAGVPSLVLAAALPDTEVVALDTVGRKVEWVVGCAERMGLRNLRGVHARAEAWRDGFGRIDVVTARAVAPLGVLLEYAAPLLVVGGALVAWKGALDEEEWRTGVSAAAQLELDEPVVRATSPWLGARDHRLVVARKAGETPGRFPRREGMARKRPLR